MAMLMSPLVARWKSPPPRLVFRVSVVVCSSRWLRASRMR